MLIKAPDDYTSLYAKGNTLIIGNWGYIYTSNDFGNTWATPISYGPICYITSIMKSSDGTLFAGVISFMGEFPVSGVICSKDNGSTWERSGLDGKRISSIVENSQGVLFAGVQGDDKGDEYVSGSLFKSNDMGHTWTLATNDFFNVSSIVVDNNDIIYRNRQMGSAMPGVFRSIDNASTWQQLTSGMDNNYPIHQLNISQDGYLYAKGSKLYVPPNPLQALYAPLRQPPIPRMADKSQEREVILLAKPPH